MSVSLINGHIDRDTNRMTDKENYPPLRKVSIAEQYEFYKEITEQEEQKLRNQIIRQQEQLDNYSRNVRIMTKTIRENQTLIDELVHTCKKQQAEIERLKEDNFIKSQKRANIFEIVNAHEKGRAKAIKEFWSRLQGIAYQSSDWSHGEHPMVVELDDAEEIYEEMVGE